jgi:hypothetical protein
MRRCESECRLRAGQSLCVSLAVISISLTRDEIAGELKKGKFTALFGDRDCRGFPVASAPS